MTALGEVAAVFLRLGTTAFGGPAAHIAMMRDEVVRRRQWLTDNQLLDLIAAVNLIPGPNSTELAIHVGLRRAGWRGFAVAGLSFILPAFAIVTGLAVLYVRYGTTPQARWLMYGIGPVIIAVVADALAGFTRQAVTSWARAVVVTVSAGLALAGLTELAILAGAGLAMAAWRVGVRALGAALIAGGLALTSPTVCASGTIAATVPFSIGRLGWFFLKVGSVLFGSGYVLLAFLRGDLVARWGWLSEQQLLDAVAVGQITPGPLFTTATFIGYVLAGLPGAVVATVAIFAPAFVFVALTHRSIETMRASAVTSAVLDGLTLASVGLMAAVTVRLAQSTLVDVPAAFLAVVAFAVLRLARPNATWLLAAGAAAGWFLHG